MTPLDSWAVIVLVFLILLIGTVAIMLVWSKANGDD